MRRFVVLSVLAIAALIFWNRLPRPSATRAEPVLRVPPEDSATARRMVKNLFVRLAAPIDTVTLSATNELYLTMKPGAYSEPVLTTESGCDMGMVPDIAMGNVIAAAYALYGKSRGVKRVNLSVPRVPTAPGDWFTGHRCKGGPVTMSFPDWQLDSPSVAVAERR